MNAPRSLHCSRHTVAAATAAALVLCLLIPAAVGAFTVPMPPVSGQATDGVSAPDAAPWPATALPQILGIWSFDEATRLFGLRGGPPVIASNLVLVPSPWGRAVRLAADAPACLRFPIREKNGNGEFSVRNGSVSLWMRPEWSAGSPGAPSVRVPLVEAGVSTAARTGWWALVVGAGGGEVQLLGQARGQEVSGLRSPVPFVAGTWIHLALSWTATRSELFVNGQRVAIGAGMTHWPGAADREALGWGLGGDRSGHLRLRADFDLLVTANYPMPPATVLAQYQSAARHLATPPAGSATDFAAPRLPSAHRTGLWIEAALGALTRAPGGWLRGTVAGADYELFLAQEPSGPWTLDQRLSGPSGRDWTAFTLKSPGASRSFVAAARWVDSDQDGLSDEYERRVSRTHPALADTDGDGMPDGWEVQYGLDPRTNDGHLDKDGDGVVNALEFIEGRNPSVADPMPLVSVRASVATLREGGSSGKFILRRSGSNARPLEVGLSLHGPAVNGLDYAELPERVTFAAGKSEIELIVTALKDGRDEWDEAVSLSVLRGAVYAPDPAATTAQILIQDDDLPVVSIEAADPLAREPEFGRTDPGLFVVRRSGLTEAPLKVLIRTGSGNNAVAGTDVQALPAFVTIPAGAVRASIPVHPLNNGKLTGPKLVVAEIAPSATAYVIESGGHQATVTLADVEPLVVTVTAETPMAEEKGLKPGRFKFTRAGGSARPLTVHYHVGGTATPGFKDYTRHPGDYEALPESVTLPAGSNDVLVEVRPIADTLVEPLETVEVTLAGSIHYTIGTANSATITIDDSNTARWTSRTLHPTSVAGADGPEGLIEVVRVGTVLTDMTLPFQVSGQRTLKPSGQVLSFGDPKLAGHPASYQLSVSGGRLGSTAGTLLMPKGVVTMRVGLKATLPSAEVRGATLILAPGTAQQNSHEIFFLDRWHLVNLEAGAGSLIEGAQSFVKFTAAATDPAGVSATGVRLILEGSAEASDIAISGAAATGIGPDGLRYVDVVLPAKPAQTGAARSATLTLRALADGKAEPAAELVVVRYDTSQLSSALSATQQRRPYTAIQIRDSTAIVLPPVDCDGDGLPDAYELDHGLDPLTPNHTLKDSDRDGLLDQDELVGGTRHDRADTDGDGVNDFIERLLGMNPLVPDPGLAAQLRDYVPVRLRTVGAFREEQGACYRCHAPGMALDGVEQLSFSHGRPGGPGQRHSIVLSQDLLLPPGRVHQVSLTLPPRYKANPTQLKGYHAEILPLESDRPPGFVILESDPTKPLLGQNRTVDSATFTTRKATLRVLRPPLLGVDADRDGQIRFDESDATSPTRPYRFWVNNDVDSQGNAAAPLSGAYTEDHADAIIRSPRDLEDFTRLWVDLQGLQSGLSAAGLELAFEWRSITEGSPSLQIYKAVETDGGLNYLNNVQVASQQSLPNAKLPEFAQALPFEGTASRRIAPGARYRLNRAYWTSGVSRRHLLFEAASRGRGQLVLMLLQQGRILVESPPLHLELLDVKEMYSRVQATPSNAFPPPYEEWSKEPTRVRPGLAPLLPAHPFRRDPEATPRTATFVHGWNMPLAEAVDFAETQFKRLWHAGYRGDYVLFRWPTGWLSKPEVLDREFFNSYNFSEHRALVYGASLKAHIESIRPEARNRILCHSMGGMVVASALRQGIQPSRTLYFQSATPAGMFDLNPNLDQQELLRAEALAPTQLKTPDPYFPHGGYRGFLIGATGEAINYYNTEDFALQTGSFAFNTIDANWIKNQTQKPHLPDANFGRGYLWIRMLPTSSLFQGYLGIRASAIKLLRPVTDPHETLAFIARSRSKALGAEPATAGVFSAEDQVDLVKFGLNRTRSDHSGQFNKSCQETMTLFRNVALRIQ